MHRYLPTVIRITKHQGNITQPKEYSKSPVSGPKEMEIPELTNEEFNNSKDVQRTIREQINDLTISGTQYNMMMRSSQKNMENKKEPKFCD